jgi:esterase
MLDFTFESKTKDLKPLIFMHGLMGQMLNWRHIAKMTEISSKYSGYIVSMRNHGYSDWHDSMTHVEMAEDVLRFADQ